MDAVTGSEMAADELNARYLGVTELQLMENAGSHVALEVASRFNPRKHRVMVFSGTGGNGGDGFVAARHLACYGFKVRVILVGSPKDIENEGARVNWNALTSLRTSIETVIAYDTSLLPRPSSDVIVDALLGIGVKGVLRSPAAEAVKLINKAEAFRVAVDIPTGIDADTGEVKGEAVKAHVTVTFHKAKRGLLKAKEYVGEMKVVNIGIPPEASLYAGPGDTVQALKPRAVNAHKGDFGRLLVIGGSETYSGAPALVALAALRTGVDLSYVAAPERTAVTISSMSPDLITVKVPGEHLNLKGVTVIKPFLDAATAVVMGPGLGLHEETLSAVEEVFKWVSVKRLPTVLDADGLKAYAAFKRRVDFPMVITPHTGEYKVLTGATLPEPLQEKVSLVKATAESLHSTILLKGPVDIITDGGNVKLNLTGNPGMTVGGTGDVLSGIVGAFMAQGIAPYKSAVSAAFINGGAGDMVSKDKGFHMVASDLLDKIPVFLELCRRREVDRLRKLTLEGKAVASLIPG